MTDDEFEARRLDAMGDLRDEMDRTKGEFLTNMARIEAMTVVLIGDYFNTSHGDDLAEWILERLPLERRMALLKRILKRLDLWINHRDVWDKVERARKLRNRLAHQEVRVSADFDPDDPSTHRLVYVGRSGGDVDRAEIELALLDTMVAWGVMGGAIRRDMAVALRDSSE